MGNKIKRISQILGILYISLGLLCNEYILGYYYSPDGKIEHWLFRLLIFLFNIAMVGWGIMTFRKGEEKPFLPMNLSLSVLALLAVVLFFAEKGMQRWVYANNHFQIMGKKYSHVNTDQKVVALTYDDGPREPYTNELIDVLENNNVKATFFLIGRHIEKNPDLSRLLMAKGHQLANHTYDHAILVYKTPSFVESEIRKTNDLLRGMGVD